MSVSQALATPVDESMESSALTPRNGFHLEPPLPRVPKRRTASKSQRPVVRRGQLCPDRARTLRRTTPNSTNVIGSQSTR